MEGKYVPLATALSLVALGAGARLLPHPANFAPIGAIVIFGGAVLPKRLAVWVPLVALMASDLVIGFYDIMPIVWACYGVVALAGNRWLRRPTLLRGGLLTVCASLFFFVVTNCAVWAASGMYAHTFAGLAQCYAMALPFFRNSLLSDLLYTGVLFSVYTVATNGAKHYVGTQEQAA